ncbi:hypothetical protein VKT23_012653 [Stygiomarasmius scandens]|uniref:Ubiquitin-like protease family profile domain-containing protein n=1 Tax=Marasmiellus scandens TaxID=2682957 RepID=A0ABR1JAE3_9AGAR
MGSRQDYVEFEDKESQNSEARKSLSIPNEYLGLLLPPEHGSAIDLINYNLPSVNDPTCPPLDRTHFHVSPSPLNSPQNVIILRTQPAPTMMELRSIIPHVGEALTKGCVSVRRSMSLSFPSTGSGEMNLPIWTLTYWETVHAIWEHKKEWMRAQGWLERKGWYASVLSTLNPVPWSYTMEDRQCGKTFHLARFLSDEWLGDHQISQMIAHLRSRSSGCNGLIEDGTWSYGLIQGYRQQRERILEKAGNALLFNAVQYLAFPVFVKLGADRATILPSQGVAGNHWVAVVIKICDKQILYGDSLGHSPPNELVEALQWWLAQWEMDAQKFCVEDLSTKIKV